MTVTSGDRRKVTAGRSSVLASGASDRQLQGPASDLAPITLVTVIPKPDDVPNPSPAKSVEEFTRLRQSEPRQRKVRSTRHRRFAPFSAANCSSAKPGIEMTHVPYRGAGLRMNDLIPGRVDGDVQQLAGCATAGQSGHSAAWP